MATTTRKKPFKQCFGTHFVEGGDDANALEEEDEAHEVDEEYDDDYEWEAEEEDPDQVAYADDEGWFYDDEETIKVVDEML